jgi:anti-sigma regulatory factor (Ser/Thr protein kinase)
MPERQQLGPDTGWPAVVWLPGSDWPPCAHFELAAAPDAVPQARRLVRQVLSDWGRTDVTDTVELVVSEIVTNAVRAAGGLSADRPAAVAIQLWLIADEADVIVYVFDPSQAQPQLRQVDAEAESGRGLLLVEMLTTEWGSFRPDAQPGKVVWARCQK